MGKNNFQHFGIIGAGAWGTALAATLRRAGRDVTLWAHNPAVAEAINQHHENTFYLPHVALDAAIAATHDLALLKDCDAFLFVTPAQKLREVSAQLKAASPEAPVIIACKGIETGSLKVMSEVVRETLPEHPVAVLSGPGFAGDVVRGNPTATTLATADKGLGEALAKAIATPTFRPYLSRDVMGVELGGAIKNVLAIACGIVTGKKFGDGARAALITRGLVEMSRLAVARGAHPETLTGLSGLGDLVLTCSSAQSRNASLGIALGEGQRVEAILAARTGVTEGVPTAAATLAMAQKYGIDMPITASVDAIVNRGASVDAVIAALLARPLKTEGA
jgi:glycerol-3-phosphate dehydrogenase (NAD(P)+)